MSRWGNEWAEQHRKPPTRPAYIEKDGWNEKVGAYTQSYGSEHMDASNLLMLDYGFCEPDDPRFIATVDKTFEELAATACSTKALDDFGETNSCSPSARSGWPRHSSVSAVSMKARMFEDLLDCTNHLGPMAEDLTFENRRQLGNFPQAYSHLCEDRHALAINAAWPKSRWTCRDGGVLILDESGGAQRSHS